MVETLKIALAQLNPTVGDVPGNLALIRAARAEAARGRADLLLCGELAISGYPPEDLVLKPAFQKACRDAVTALAAETVDSGPALLLGTPWVEDGLLYNALLLLDGGGIAAIRYKHDLPNYGVFDEKRLFASGPLPEPVLFRGISLGAMICEDLWYPDVSRHLADKGAGILLLPNGSPYEHDKSGERLSIAHARRQETGLPIIYVNQAGGQDELVFDGASFVLDASGALRWLLPAFREALAITDWQRDDKGVWHCRPGTIAPAYDEMETIYQAMMLGLRDYVAKNRFAGVILGLSGGIDSALTAAVAVDALGPARVHAVMLPSPYTAPESLEDAAACARMLGIAYEVIPIERAMQAFADMLSDAFAGRAPDTTEENIQSRIRGLTLMALSNKLGHMLLTTGNKSEMSVGYATIYGDMCGGYSVLKDIYKTMVFALARWRNTRFPHGGAGQEGSVMPQRVIDKPPSAELRPGQIDQDSLPPYDMLDGILECLIEQELSVEAIIAKGFARATVLKVWRMLDLAEYKRRQAPPGVKITRRAFGRDRRYPITNGFRAPS